MYRFATLKVGAADDSNLSSPIFGPREMTAYQVRDNESCAKFVRVGTSDAQTEVTIAPVTAGYFVAVFSDYPIRIRINDVAGTQFTLTSNNVANVNATQPLPDMCYFSFTGTVTSVFVQPIASAAQTANVKILVTGDPTSSYT